MLKRCVVALWMTSLLVVVGLGEPASAGGGGGDTSGSGLDANAKATVRLGGDVSGGGVQSASAPALCWWEPIGLDTDGADALAVFIQLATFGLSSSDREAVQKVHEAEEEDGESYQWYARQVSENATDAQLEAAGCNDPSGPFRGLFVGNVIRPFKPGDPPAPLPDPTYMAEVAMEHVDIDAPQLDWNPKAEQLGGGTLVNLPTWFWVTNPAPAIGDEHGKRSITATAGSGARKVSVTVTAKAGQVQITSPGGAATCSDRAARVAWARDVSQSSACTLAFRRASNRYDSGFPVRASVGWSASWTGTGPGVAAGVHPLDAITRSSTSQVPVHESQATVQSVG